MINIRKVKKDEKVIFDKDGMKEGKKEEGEKLRIPDERRVVMRKKNGRQKR